MIKDTYRVEIINNYSFLARIIEFLKKGFDQSDLYAYKLLDHLLTMNPNSLLQPFGYALFEEDQLIGALLTAHQGNYINNNGKAVSVINLSDWFVSEKSRGIPALIHAKKFIELTKESIITAYTFGEASFKIYERLGFKKMKVLMYRKYKPKFRKLIFHKTIVIKEISNSQIDKRLLPLEKINHLPNIFNFSIKLENNNTIYFSGVKKRVKIKAIYLKSFYILWSSDYYALYKEFDNVHKYLYFNYGCISLFYYVPSFLINKYNLDSKNFREVPFMYKSNFNIDYISPIGSELSLGQF